MKIYLKKKELYEKPNRISPFLTGANLIYTSLLKTKMDMALITLH